MTLTVWFCSSFAFLINIVPSLLMNHSFYCPPPPKKKKKKKKRRKKSPQITSVVCRNRKSDSYLSQVVINCLTLNNVRDRLGVTDQVTFFFLKNSYNQYFDYSATMLHYPCVSMPPAAGPSLMERWTWGL